MEREGVRRRMDIISGHFTAHILTHDSTLLFPLNCSSNLSGPFTRLDNRLDFGRQASTAQGYFMKQSAIPNEENRSSNLSSSSTRLDNPFTRLDNRLYFGRQASSAQGYFMREATIPNEKDNPIQQSGVRSSDYIKEENPVASRPPCFSRPATLGPYFAKPAQMEFKCSNEGIIEAPTQHESLPPSQSPKFARPRAIAEGKEFNSCKERNSPSQIMGTEWLPRINVAESKSSHVITVELPGVDISDIRVEMDEKNIIVKGKRSMKLTKAASCSNDFVATYHRMEISEGPYHVVWPIPVGTKTDSVSAEFVEGMLQITVPKL